MDAGEALVNQVQLTENERAIRERFVGEYLTDYDAFGAAIRIGYSEAYARTFASQFMQETYVRQLITKGEEGLGVVTENDQHKRKIITGLYRIANSRNVSASAQVAAFAKLSGILGLDAPVKTQQEVIVKDAGPELGHLSVEELEQIKLKLYAPPAPAPVIAPPQ